MYLSSSYFFFSATTLELLPTGVILIEICYSLIKSFIGCGVWRTFLQIVFPLLMPVIATVAILNTLHFHAKIYH
ncbi:hypothetical protein NSQ90_18085 [Paenibacillus sp. FSL H7-0737]|uniref:hypothetical protein n=1 Tax=Paenibacillus sp. FSL H7-0737 TaxID=1536775 RepID=UPI000AE9C661